jgi:hypothetical protein
VGDRPTSEKIVVTSDKYSNYLASEYRSCLNELYSLRDAVLAAAFRLNYKRNDPFAIKKLKSLVLSDDSSISTLISQSMFDSSGDHIIDRISLYRSIAQHCLGATNPVIGDVYRLFISRGPYGELPYLVFPLYDDIEKMRAIEAGSSRGIFEPPPRSEAERFLGLPSPSDALDFCYDCFVRLLRICEVLAAGKRHAHEARHRIG